ncbi:MAG TPA: aminotransferase class I/II-fold pyridoxal phosphate-dependent enzyme [Candidatus Limnocylindria bacterium]|nr:aminotransferase class I/II-fold pyridoxal phosphate-dependent enzyme [Candidatus Limnocylindria bacterium]
MRFPAFDMERMQSVWEHKVRYDLSESGVEPLTLEEAARDPRELLKMKLGYAEGVGLESTRTYVSELHPKSTAANVVITTGTSEANFLAMLALVSAGDEVVVVMPNYMQVHGIALGLGARVREVWLREERGWTIDLDALAAAVTAKTRVICVCTPNNPTGQALSSREVDEVVAIAARHGAWILADEVYRGAEREGGAESASFAGRGERVVVTGGLSKAYGLPGLRIGWVVAPEETAQAILTLKDYTTIAPSSVSEVLADIALERRAKLLERTRFLLNERWPALEEWAATHARELHWTPPAAGAICFFSYRFPIDSMPFVDRLIRDYSTMVVPGIHFKTERHLRIGFGGPPSILHAGLAAIDRLLATIGD